MPVSELIRLVSTMGLVAVCVVTLLLLFLSLGRPREDAELIRLPPAASVKVSEASVYRVLLFYA